MKHCVFAVLFLIASYAPGHLFAQEAAQGEAAAQTSEEIPPKAIIIAAYKGDVDMVRVLLAARPDPDVRDDFGATALHEAIFSSNPEIIRLLLDYGFDVNAQVPLNGYTPLHYAVWLNRPEVVKILLAYKADKTIKDKKGQTPLEKASKEGKRELIIALTRK
jgi:ankyrin repeat protein